MWAYHKLLTIDKLLTIVQLESSLQAKAYLAESKTHLGHMLRLLNVKEQLVVTMSVVTDFTYAWQLLAFYVDSMQALLRQEPRMVVGLRALFVKIATAMDMPLLRINQAQSSDLISVSQYYSARLVAFVQRVVHIIPATLFRHLDTVIRVETNALKDPPSRISRDQLGVTQVQMDERYRLAGAIQSIAKLAEGLLLMEKTLVGVIEVIPRQLLESGLRRELIDRLTDILHRTVRFGTGGKRSTHSLARNTMFCDRLQQCASELDGLRRAFESVQDFLNVPTARLWLEEYTQVLTQAKQLECAHLSRPIDGLVASTIADHEGKDSTVYGRLVAEMMRLSEQTGSAYLRKTLGWYDVRSGHHLLNADTVRHIDRALGPIGLAGVDRVLGCMVRQNVRHFFEHVLRVVDVDGGSQSAANSKGAASYARHVGATARLLEETATLPPSYAQLYPAMAARTDKVICGADVNAVVARIGRLTLMRRTVRTVLNVSAWDRARLLASTTRHSNDAYDCLDRSEAHKELSADSTIRLAELMDTVGAGEMLRRRYDTWDWSGVEREVCTVLLLHMLALSARLVWNADFGTLTWRHKADMATLDGVPVAAFYSVVWAHLSAEMVDRVCALLGQYVRTGLNSSSGQLSQDMHTLLHIIKLISWLGRGSDHDYITACIDKYCDPLLDFN